MNFVSSFSVIDGSVVAKGNPKQITSTDSLCGLRVVAPAGTYEANTLVPSVSATCKQEGKKAVTLVLADQAVAAMQAGRGDIYLTALSDVESIAKQTSSLQTGFSISLPILNGFPMAKSDTTLANAILGGMKVIQAQGLEQPLLTNGALQSIAAPGRAEYVTAKSRTRRNGTLLPLSDISIPARRQRVSNTADHHPPCRRIVVRLGVRLVERLALPARAPACSGIHLRHKRYAAPLAADLPL